MPPDISCVCHTTPTRGSLLKAIRIGLSLQARSFLSQYKDPSPSNSVALHILKYVFYNLLFAV